MQRGRPAIGKLGFRQTDYQRRRTAAAPICRRLPVSASRSSGRAGDSGAEQLQTATARFTTPGRARRQPYGIPSFGSKVLDDKVEYLRQIGVEFVLNTWVGRDVIDDLLEKHPFNAVFVGTGAPVEPWRSRART
jgi:hypothetical protein